eukprot:7215920-Pyramimonas_sp.AAC.1
MCLLFYLHDREDAQFDINYLTSCISSPREADVRALEAGKVPEGHEGPGRADGQAHHAAGDRRPGRVVRLRLGRRREGAEEPDQ